VFYYTVLLWIGLINFQRPGAHCISLTDAIRLMMFRGQSPDTVYKRNTAYNSSDDNTTVCGV